VFEYHYAIVSGGVLDCDPFFAVECGPSQTQEELMLTRNRMAVGTMVIDAMLLATCVVGCSDIQVESAWAPRAAAVPLGPSFAWMADQASPPGTSGPVNPQLQELIRGVVESGFAAKGYEKRSSGPADFWIVCRMAKDTRGDAYAASNFEQYTEGTLEIYVVDPRDSQWIWKAWAQTRIDDTNPPETKRQRLQQAVDRMLKRFPARGQPASTAKN